MNLWGAIKLRSVDEPLDETVSLKLLGAIVLSHGVRIEVLVERTPMASPPRPVLLHRKSPAKTRTVEPHMAGVSTPVSEWLAERTTYISTMGDGVLSE